MILISGLIVFGLGYLLAKSWAKDERWLFKVIFLVISCVGAVGFFIFTNEYLPPVASSLE